MTDFNLAIADKHQLKFYAKGLTPMLNLTLNMSEETMRQRIQDHCVTNNLEKPVAEVTTSKGKRTKDLIRINVSKVAGKDGSSPIFVGVQGHGYTIPRGIEVDVPAAIVEVLKNAMQDIVTQDSETGEIYHEDVLTYPFQIVAGGN